MHGPLDGMSVPEDIVPYVNGSNEIKALTSQCLHTYTRDTHTSSVFILSNSKEAFEPNITRKEWYRLIDSCPTIAEGIDILVEDMFPEDIEEVDPEFFHMIDKDTEYEFDERKLCESLGPSKDAPDPPKHGGRHSSDDIWRQLDDWLSGPDRDEDLGV
jgi:hypothetical protein